MNIDANRWGDIDCTAKKIRGLTEVIELSVYDKKNEPCYIDDTLYLLYELTEKLNDTIDLAADDYHRQEMAKKKTDRDMDSIVKLEVPDCDDMTASEMDYIFKHNPSRDLFCVMGDAFKLGYYVGQTKA